MTEVMVGGFGGEQQVSDEVRQLVIERKAEIEKSKGQAFKTFEVVSFQQQVVAGINYSVKIKVDNEKHILVKLYKPLPHTGEQVELTSVADA